MKIDNNNEFPDELKEAIRIQLRRQLVAGIGEGAYAMCSSINRIAKDDSKSVEDRIQEIIAFCAPMIQSYESASANSEGS